MTSADEIVETIEESGPKQWIRWEQAPRSCRPDEPDAPVSVYKPDIQLRIEWGDTLEENYSADWPESIDTKGNHRSGEVWVMYGNSPVDRFTVLDVGDTQIFIPISHSLATEKDELSISKYECKIGEALSLQSDYFWNYLAQADITVEG